MIDRELLEALGDISICPVAIVTIAEQTNDVTKPIRVIGISENIVRGIPIAMISVTRSERSESREVSSSCSNLDPLFVRRSRKHRRVHLPGLCRTNSQHGFAICENCRQTAGVQEHHVLAGPEISLLTKIEHRQHGFCGIYRIQQ